MYGGAWCDGAESRGKMLDDWTLQISADDEAPLRFAAEHSKPLGTDDAATNVTVSFSCAFQPFSRMALPAVPPDAKGAVILVTDAEDPDEAPGGELYYAAYDPNGGTNAWMASGLTTTTDWLVDVVVLISHDVPGFLTVTYDILGSKLAPVQLMQSDAVVNGVYYAGTGRTSGLESRFKTVDPYLVGETEYADFTTMNAVLQDGDTVVMQLNDTLPVGAAIAKQVTFRMGRYALSTVTGQDLTISNDVAFTAYSSEGLRRLSFYVRADQTLTLPSGTAFGAYLLAGEDYAYVAIGDDEWVRYGGRWLEVGLMVMRFFYPGYFGLAAETLCGYWGRPIRDDRLGAFLDDIESDDHFQNYYWDAETEQLIDYVYWFDGSWTWVCGGETTVTNQLPSRYLAGDFYPNSTAIVYKITYDMGGVTGATHVNPTGYTIDTRFNLGAAIPPPDSPYVFQCWTNEVGSVVTGVDPVAIGGESGRLCNITFYASWGLEPAEQMVVAIVPGDPAAYYDTSEMATAAAAAFNADKAGHIQAPAGFTGSAANYATNFEAVAKGSVLSIVLTDASKASLDRRIGEDMADAAKDLANPVATKVKITRAEPGFYYMILGGTEAGVIAKEGVRTLAHESTVELRKPYLGETDKAFFKIGAAVKP